MEMFEALLSVNFWSVAAGIFAVILSLRRSYPRFFAKRRVKRALPLVPLIIGAGVMMFVPGLSNFDELGARFFQGLIAGFVAANFHKIGKQTILGKGIEEGDNVSGA